VAKDLVDEMIDLMLDHRQSGHPGGSRSKVHLLLATLLSGAMRWDVLRPWRPLSDRFVLSAGHTVPLIYATLAVLNEAMRQRHAREGGTRFAFPDGGRWALTWEDLLRLRRRGGLPGHAEMEGKTLFLKWNTGPSGHGMPPAAGQAVALKIAGASEVKVFVMEGGGWVDARRQPRDEELRLGPGPRTTSSSCWTGTTTASTRTPSPRSCTAPPRTGSLPMAGASSARSRGWSGGPVTRTVLEATRGEGASGRPTVAWVRTRKGRGYGKYDYKSHGTPWPRHSPEFWANRKAFMDKYGVVYQGVDQPAPRTRPAREAQARANFEIALS
jgi:transketolase